MKTTIDMQMRATPIIMTYSSALANYRNTVNQRFPNESTVKRNNISIQTTYSRGGITERGGSGHQGRGERGGCGVRGRGTVSRIDDLGGHWIKLMHR